MPGEAQQDIILYWGEEKLEPRWDGNRWFLSRLREPGEKLGILGTPDPKGIKNKIKKYRSLK